MCNWDIGVSSFYRLQGRFLDLLEEGFKAICLPASYSRLLTGRRQANTASEESTSIGR